MPEYKITNEMIVRDAQENILDEAIAEQQKVVDRLETALQVANDFMEHLEERRLMVEAIFWIHNGVPIEHEYSMRYSTIVADDNDHTYQAEILLVHIGVPVDCETTDQFPEGATFVVQTWINNIQQKRVGAFAGWNLDKARQVAFDYLATQTLPEEDDIDYYITFDFANPIMPSSVVRTTGSNKIGKDRVHVEKMVKVLNEMYGEGSHKIEVVNNGRR